MQGSYVTALTDTTEYVYHNIPFSFNPVQSFNNSLEILWDMYRASFESFGTVQNAGTTNYENLPPTATRVFDYVDYLEPTTQTTTHTSTSRVNTGGFKTVNEEIRPGVSLTKGSYVNLNGLKTYMKDKLIKLQNKAQELGYKLVVIDGFRSHATQAAAYRKKPKWAAKPGLSAHEYGVGIDLALYKNGKQVSIDKVPGFGEYAESLGLEWGARWQSKKEPWHFNMKNWRKLPDVAPEYNRYNHRG